MNLRKHIRKLSTLSLSVAAAAILWFVLSTGDSAPTTMAQTADTPTPVPTPAQSEGSDIQNLPPIKGKLNPPQYPNMDSNLNRIVEQAQSGQFTARAAAANAPIHDGASVAVTLYITKGYADAISGYLSDNGGAPRNVGTDYIEAYVPVSLLADISQQEGVISVQTIVPPEPTQGVVVSEGVRLHGVPAWHTADIKGQGVKIGVIDTGFEGFRSLMGTELPAAGSVRARCYTDIGVLATDVNDCIDSSGSKHGTTVTEVAFDIAPESTYYISNPISLGDLKSVVEWMVNHDVDVINMSLSWAWNGPGDGTSPFSDSPLISVDTAVAGGITFVNSAGNYAESTWFSSFTDTDSDGFHNFSAGDECNDVMGPSSGEFIIEAGEKFNAHLRWDDIWFGSNRDLDLYLYRNYGFGLLSILPVAKSEDEQLGGQRHIPREMLSYTPTSTGTYCLAVRHSSGAAPSWIQMQARGSYDLEHHTLHHSITNPAESRNPGLLAVGAANWRDTNSINSYSSQGPTPDGRIKPDIVGTSGGQSISRRSTDNPNGYFGGTSSSSSHVAGLAALTKQRFPNYSPQQVTRYLKDNAEARGAVPNNTWGYGFAKLPASDATQPTPVPTATVPPTATPTTVPTPGNTPEPTATSTTVPTPGTTPEPTATPTTVPTPGTTPEPTATPTTVPTLEPTPVTPTVPPEVLNRISMLETLVATLQGLIATLQSAITTLDSRVTALETSASAPTPIPTATFTPTPTSVPGAPTPVPTAIPTETPVPTATPVTNTCVTPITEDSVISASWISGCESTNRPKDPDADSGTYYARYYTFDITTPSTVTITLASSEDTFLYLLNGKGKTGTVAHSNDDIEYPDNSNSQIAETLQVGSYTIEAATYDSGTVGSSFTLTVSGIQ